MQFNNLTSNLHSGIEFELDMLSSNNFIDNRDDIKRGQLTYEFV